VNTASQLPSICHKFFLGLDFSPWWQKLPAIRPLKTLSGSKRVVEIKYYLASVSYKLRYRQIMGLMHDYARNPKFSTKPCLH